MGTPQPFWHEDVDRLAEQFVASVPKQPLRLSVHQHDRAGLLHDSHRIWHCFEQRAERFEQTGRGVARIGRLLTMTLAVTGGRMSSPSLVPGPNMPVDVRSDFRGLHLELLDLRQSPADGRYVAMRPATAVPRRIPERDEVLRRTRALRGPLGEFPRLHKKIPHESRERPSAIPRLAEIPGAVSGNLRFGETRASRRSNIYAPSCRHGGCPHMHVGVLPSVRAACLSVEQDP